MSLDTIILEAKKSGVRFSLTQKGTVKLIGSPEAVERLIPVVREHKPALVAMLAHQSAGATDTNDCYEYSLRLARDAIERANLIATQKLSRLADLEREPSIAHFWAQLHPA